jgi:hypothetical protein
MTAGSMKRARNAVLAAAAAFYAIFILRTAFAVGDIWYFTLFDDAMISMRYARNLAAGRGLVWNPGEAPVEGFTNLLWTVWMAMLHVAGLAESKVALAVMITGAAMLLATTVMAWKLAETLDSRASTAPVIAAALVAFSYPLIFWTLRGMEVGLLACALTMALLAAARLRTGWSGRWISALVASTAVAVLTRQDAIVPHALIAVYCVAVTPLGRRALAAGLLSAALMLPAAGHLAFSSWYYGDPLPNTYYLKLTGSPFAERLARGSGALGVTVGRHLAPLLILAWFARTWQKAVRELDPSVSLAAVVVAQAGYSAFVGGDAWEWMGYSNRYLTPVIPALAVLAARGFVRVTASALSFRVVTAGLCLSAALQFLVALVLARLDRGVDGVLRSIYMSNPTGYSALSIGGAAALCGGALALARRGVGLRLQQSPVARMALVVAVALLVNGVPIGMWISSAGYAVDDDAGAARLGLLIRRATTSRATVAVTWAGSIPYFADRTCIDILGKTDPVIARLPPVIQFVPGHDRWDLNHSIGTLHPDLVIGLPLRPPDSEYLRRAGYSQLPSTVFVRLDSDRVDATLLMQSIAGRQTAAR